MDHETTDSAFEQATRPSLMEGLLEGIVGNVVREGGTRTVFGTPVQDHGRTVIPVARVSYRFGFGGGSGTGPKVGGDGPAPGGDGGGGGGMLHARPVGFIETDSTGSVFIPVIDWSRIIQSAIVVSGLASLVFLWRR